MDINEWSRLRLEILLLGYPEPYDALVHHGGLTELACNDQLCGQKHGTLNISLVSRYAESFGGDEDEDLGFRKPQRIIDREDDYRKRRLSRVISPDRNDAFAMGDKTPDVSVRTYADVMREEALKREKEEALRAIATKKKEEEENTALERDGDAGSEPVQATKRGGTGGTSLRNRMEVPRKQKIVSLVSDWDMPDSTPKIGQWDATFRL
ncbi:hypothetical protein HHK36_011646 [Tetracentron sinense]|uniref:Uncharacterized protein n=1 Tax=Tetracentron sinense TaxID=13715 RepID=A0A834ZBG7_TETSI|nr:hypothetical protein HHK36_011646 [Tetracentron sinense]